MKKKKLLFLINHIFVFKAFFQSEIKSLSKIYDIYFLVSNYGFDNSKFSKEQKIWFKQLEKKKTVKKIILINDITYTNFYKNFLFNKKLIFIINYIKSIKIDYFLFPNMSSYWEEIFFNVFKHKKIFCYLTNPPSGIDHFNSLINFKRSFKDKKIYKTFEVKSDNNQFHNQNTKPLISKNIFNFVFYKINIFLSKQINHIILPIFLFKKTINPNSMYYKLNINFLKFKKIIIFNQEFKNLLKKLLLGNNKKVFFCSKNSKKSKTKNFNWIIAYSSNENEVLSKLFEYLKMLKKLKKITKVYLKGHPTWKHKKLEKSFFTKLKNAGINYTLLDSNKNINYSKYYGLISIPSSIILESAYNKPNIKIIVIKSKNYASGMLHKFYSATKENNFLEPTYKKLKKYLEKNNQQKKSLNNFRKILLEN